MTENDLAKNLKIPYNTINRIITGETTDPRLSTLEKISDFFDVKLDFFLGKHNNEMDNLDYNIPILTWDLLSHTDFIQKIDRNNWKKWIPAAQLLDHIYPIEKLFALESTKSMQPRFPFGTTFIIKMDNPIDGDLVLVRFKKDNSISLRELVIDSPNWQLNPIISGSKNILFNHLDHIIIGVVILMLIQNRA